MTYVSRKTRIIVSGWPDECNAEYLLQAFRKRSDGKLKNYSSCDDLRAWINDNCVKNEYLLDLMSKSEFLGAPPFALYGRFIPVPILFKLLENGKENGGKEKETENLKRVQWEKNQAEKNLLECTCLLNTAVRKLEKLEYIIEVANSETQIARAKDIKDAFRKAKEVCGCSDCQSSSLSSLNMSQNQFTSPVRESKDPNTYDKLMRKISQLKRKLEEVQACRCQIIHQIQKAERCAPFNQVKQLFNREDQSLIKKLQRELEKLIAEKGRLLSEMWHVLNSLNSLKISSKGNFSGGRECMRSNENRETSGGCTRCSCGCKSFENYESTDTEVVEFMDSTYAFDDTNKRTNDITCENSGPPEKLAANCGDEAERLYNDIKLAEHAKKHGMSSDYAGIKSLSSSNFSNRNQYSTSSTEEFQNLKKAEGKVKVKPKKSRVKFICDSTPCTKKFYPDELSTFESLLTSKQKAIISKAVKSIQNLRPGTTPTTSREKRELTLKSESPRQNVNESGKIFLRRVKSETLIKEFEKTLRNYERRLNNLNSLECKLENLKQKSSEVYWLRKKLTKAKAEAQKQRAAEKGKFVMEIKRLCSENWELKNHIQQLTVKFKAKCKKIQILKRSALKARELECETEELKKELSKYRDGFEHQRKCISKWENVFAMQRTEIENLMNHIRKLTAVKEEPQCVSYQEKKYIQRSRSYSPEAGKSRIRRKASKDFGLTSEEEENSCCCGECPQLEGRRKVQARSLSRSCFSPTNGIIPRQLQRHYAQRDYRLGLPVTGKIRLRVVFRNQ